MSLAGGGCEPQTSDDAGSAAAKTSALQSSEAVLAERARVQELLKYFKPFQSPGPREAKAKVATDTALTAFAQLCALRLGTERAFISLIDDTKQYIAAEATRSISLKDGDDGDGPDDALFLGQCLLDFEWGVCPNTLAAFTSPDASLDIDTALVKACRSHYVMNDMSELEDYKTRSYVAGWPHMKYYAEVPIHSPSGIVIGTLCVVDNKARAGLDTQGLSILQEIAECVMNHLELCVSKIQRNQAEKMIQALGEFVEGKGSMRGLWIETQASRSAEPGRQHLSVEERADAELGLHRSGHRTVANVIAQLDGIGQRPLQNARPSTGTSLVQEPLIQLEPPPLREESTGSETQFPSGESSVEGLMKLQSPPTSVSSHTTAQIRPAGPHLEKTVMEDRAEVSSDLEKMLSRATNLIREGLGLEGIVLFDPRSSDGQLLTELNLSGHQVTLSEGSCDVPAASLDQNPDTVSLSADEERMPDTFCRVLATSTRNRPGVTDSGDEVTHVTESTLHQLLKHLPRGGVLKYDKKGFLGGDNFISNSQLPKHSASRLNGMADFEGITATGEGSYEADQLRTILPEVKSILLFPLWDTNSDKWFAHGMAWTMDPTRVLVQQDLTYISSFGNSIMAELSRLEIAAADYAKSGFISSISHELRSPLHGIMASVELLRDLHLESVPDEIVSTIKSCGSSLLDTIENLLTFAKVDRTTARKDSSDRQNTATVDLASIVEDVTEMLIAGHYFHQSASAPGTHDRVGLDLEKPSPLIIICDISPGCDWIFEADPGIWKRILMNLLGNSLKYTTSGYILVKLRMGESPQREAEINRTSSTTLDSKSHAPTASISEIDSATSFVTLTVEDSGKGISQDYLTHHLYKPFFQEDVLSPGTGLGLSIVSQLVTAIGGETKVASELGVGTRVSVSASMSRRNGAARQLESPSIPALQGRSLAFVGLDPIPDLAEVPNGILDTTSQGALATRSVLAAYASSYGMKVVTIDNKNFDIADVVLITESEFRRLNLDQDSTLRKTMIVLAAQPELKYGHEDPQLGSVTILSQPFGPQRLRQALESCLDLVEASGEASAPSASAQQHEPLPETDNVVSKPLVTRRKVDAGPTPPLHQNRISLLLVEDNPINLRLLVASFSKLGHAFTTATDGAQAVSAYRAQNGAFDMVFMDIQMPIMNGMEATAEIRKLEKQRGLRKSIIIALTALTSAKDEQAAMDSGVDRFMSKPVSMQRLRELVAEIHPGEDDTR